MLSALVSNREQHLLADYVIMTMTDIQENGARKMVPISGISFMVAKLPLPETHSR